MPEIKKNYIEIIYRYFLGKILNVIKIFFPGTLKFDVTRIKDAKTRL